MHSKNSKKMLFGLALALVLLLGLINTGYGAEQSVDIKASIAQRLVFSLDEGGTVNLVASPADNPTAEGASAFNVRTNVGSYSITATFGSFEVGDTDYDLIDQENFRIRSVAPDEGDAIYDWTVPSEEIAVLSGETGLTNLETTAVYYQLNVDFSVPSGGASTTIVFTATASM